MKQFKFKTYAIRDNVSPGAIKKHLENLFNEIPGFRVDVKKNGMAWEFVFSLESDQQFGTACFAIGAAFVI